MAEGDYEVGYRKPPIKSRFQKGQSGNPGGKRRRKLTFAEEVERQLDRQILVPTRGKTTKRKMSVRRVAAMNFAQQLLNSNAWAIKQLVELEKAATDRFPEEETPLEFTLKLEEDARDPDFPDDGAGAS